MSISVLYSLGAMHLSHVCKIFMSFSICVIVLTPQCNGGNILVFPVDGSHWINMKVLLEELHARGHNITVIRPSTSWYIVENSHLFSTITIKLSEDSMDFFDDFLQEQMTVRDYKYNAYLKYIFGFIYLAISLLYLLMFFSPKLILGSKRRHFTADFVQDHQKLFFHDYSRT